MTWEAVRVLLFCAAVSLGCGLAAAAVARWLLPPAERYERIPKQSLPTRPNGEG